MFNDEKVGVSDYVHVKCDHCKKKFSSFNFFSPFCGNVDVTCLRCFVFLLFMCSLALGLLALHS